MRRSEGYVPLRVCASRSGKKNLNWHTVAHYYGQKPGMIGAHEAGHATGRLRFRKTGDLRASKIRLANVTVELSGYPRLADSGRRTKSASAFPLRNFVQVHDYRAFVDLFFSYVNVFAGYLCFFQIRLSLYIQDSIKVSGIISCFPS